MIKKAFKGNVVYRALAFCSVEITLTIPVKLVKICNMLSLTLSWEWLYFLKDLKTNQEKSYLGNSLFGLFVSFELYERLLKPQSILNLLGPSSCSLGGVNTRIRHPKYLLFNIKYGWIFEYLCWSSLLKIYCTMSK